MHEKNQEFHRFKPRQMSSPFIYLCMSEPISSQTSITDVLPSQTITSISITLLITRFFDGTICLMEIIQVKQTLSRISPLLGLDLYQIMSHQISTGKILYSHDAPSFHLCWYLEVPFEYEIHNHLPTFSFKNQSWLIHGPLLCRVR